LGQVAKAQACAGFFEDALTTAAMAGEAQRVETLSAIGIAQMQSGAEDEAERVFAEIVQSMEAIEYKHDGYMKALYAIVQSQVQATKINDAYETAAAIEWYTLRAKALATIAVTQVQIGQEHIAHQTFAEAVQVAAMVDDLQRAGTLEAIALAQTQVGYFSDAFRSAIAITTNTEKCSGTLQKIATAQARAGFGFDALVTAEAILTERENHLPAIAEALLDAGDLANFKQLLIPCANYLEAAYTMCGLLARAYPDQANAIASVIIEQGQGDRA
jgi:uncharacterized protein YerC